MIYSVCKTPTLSWNEAFSLSNKLQGVKYRLFYFYFLGCRPQLEDQNYLIFPHSVLRSEIRDLHLVLQSSDKELATVKEELHAVHSKQQNEMSQLSNSLISTQLQLDKVQ